MSTNQTIPVNDTVIANMTSNYTYVEEFRNETIVTMEGMMMVMAMNFYQSPKVTFLFQR